jgi:hypothetical protein
MPLGPNEMDCCTSVKSTEFVLPRPYPCCGWVQPPASVSGTYRCTSTPSFLCGGLPTADTAFTLPISNYCGSVYSYFSEGFPFYFAVSLSLCGTPTGTVVGTVGGVGAGSFTPADGNGCSFVAGVYNFRLSGTLVLGSTQLRIDITAVTM